ncbi:PREDICTED: peroxisome assembly protein 26 [Nanorana parkeri]|uniref:peroxisome assembly protein 26 n=1 Tax=Nanorana parkeri TaxID=125878 RepID=UPI00085419BF|nr:PREDICTED: peroxisome assembly protein 26 [Nanorana parkeri]
MAVTENVSSCSLSAMWDWSHLSLSGTAPTVCLLDAAADLLVLERNFAGALELCERGLQILSAGGGDTKNAQVKASLCVIGIQALAEMDQWREVLPWLFQYYQNAQEMPHNIMELCLLLYSSVKQPHVMLDLSRDWLRDPNNQLLPGYRKVAELHLLRILLPLGHLSEAEELVQDPRAFTAQQQEVALSAVAEQRRRLKREEEEEAERESPGEPDHPPAAGGALARRERLVRMYGALSVAVTWVRRIPLQRLLVALLLMSVILLRLDPASPMSHGPIAHLLLLLRQMANSVFKNSPPSRP